MLPHGLKPYRKDRYTVDDNAAVADTASVKEYSDYHDMLHEEEVVLVYAVLIFGRSASGI